jgi:hypothetical protein
MPDTPDEPAPRCMNLSCKSMAVYGEAFEMDPEYQEGATDFWCVCTSKSHGPDGGEVSLPACRNRERPCYREY